MHGPAPIWDPNTLFTSFAEPRRIYGDDNASVFALVDDEDYNWAMQWRWSPKLSRGGTKLYLRRNIQTTLGPQERCPERGLVRNRVQQTLFLHVAILRDRMGVLPPSPKHVLVDHRNGRGLDCRRENLRWLTRSQNARNINGSHGHILGDF